MVRVTKKELQAFADLAEEIRLLTEDLNNARESIGMRGSLSSQGGARATTNRDLSAPIARLIGQEEHIAHLTDQLERERMRIEGVITEKLIARERLVIRYRYFQGLPWPTIYQKLDMSESSMHRHHSNALRKLDPRPILRLKQAQSGSL